MALQAQDAPNARVQIFKIPGQINTPNQEFGPSISADGKELFFYSKRNGSKFTDLYVSSRTNDGSWGNPRALTEINSEYDDQSPYLANNGSYMIFSSNRDGAYEVRVDGKIGISRDLYVTNRKNGKFQTPEKLPDTINTEEMEENPHLSGSILYFTRYPFGRPDLARIFKSELKDNAWTEAEELSSPINDVHSSISLSTSEDGKEFYFASNRPGGFGGYDLYSTKLENGKWQEAQNLGPEVNTEGDEAYLVVKKSQGILLFARREPKQDYDIYQAIIIPEEVKLTAIQSNLEKDGKVVLNSIHFQRASYQILPDSYQSLDEIIQYMKSSPKLRIKIVGHTDLTGVLEDNMKLSKDRSNSVKKYFTEKGIDGNRIETDGKGPTEPLINSYDDESSKKNRRTEFFILQN